MNLHKIQLRVGDKNSNDQLPILDDVTLDIERKEAPSKLTFTVVGRGTNTFTEGNNVQLVVDDTPVFNGFVFEKEHDKAQRIKVTAYDQLRYLKNKDTYVYTNKTASEVISMIAGDFGLQLGSIANTGFKIAKRDEDNQTLFDIILNALDLTLDATGELYILYDDFGKITLKNIKDMKHDLLIQDDSAENFEYKSSIDDDVYNKAKVIIEDSDKSYREVYTQQDDGNVQKWGVLQYLLKTNSRSNGQSLASVILKAKNRKMRRLSVKNVIGDLSVRGGTCLPVTLDLGDEQLTSQYLMCEHVTHHITAARLSMDIEFYNLKDLG